MEPRASRHRANDLTPLRGFLSGTTVSEVLTRELEGEASEHAEQLSAVVPGFGAALTWPDAHAQLPC